VAEPKSVIWDLPEHSRGKHLVLRHYLGAWFPIIGSRFARFLFIDGFAGPGEYSAGELGSPIIALDTYLEHRHRPRFRAEAVFVFIEKSEERSKHLEALIEARRERIPDACKVEVVTGAFDKEMSEALDSLHAAGESLAPSFVMIDPFGVSDTPMAVIARILANPQAEVYITFMADFIERFGGTDEFRGHLSGLFGTGDWQGGLSLQGVERREFYYFLYERQLRLAGAQHVVRFDLFEGNRLVYAIFFGTGNPLGANRMKEAIWRVDPLGGFEFRGGRGGQATLQLETTDFRPLVNALKHRFRGRGPVTIGEIEAFVASDRTDYYTTQLRERALIPLEDAGAIEISPALGRKRRRHSFPPGTRVVFK